MSVNVTTTLPAPPEPGDDRRRQSARFSITDMAAVDELCGILARILMRVQSEQETNVDAEGGEA